MTKLHCTFLLVSVLACCLATEGSRSTRETVRTPKFTRKQIQSMIEGMDVDGRSYNFQGVEASDEDRYILTRPQLSALLEQTEPLRTGEFTKQQIEDMVAGTEDGKFYNFKGDEVAEGASNILTMELLNMLLEANSG